MTRRGNDMLTVATRTVREPLKPELTHVGETEEIRSRETAPGRFEAKFPWPADKAVQVIAKSGAFRKTLAAGPKSDEPAETQVDAYASFPMARAALVTNGLAYAANDQSIKVPASKGTAPTALNLIWPWFVLVSMLFFLADVFLRRRAGTFKEVN